MSTTPHSSPGVQKRRRHKSNNSNHTSHSKPIQKWWKKNLIHQFSHQEDKQDSTVAKVLTAINHENSKALDSILKERKQDLDRLKSIEVSGSSILHYACSRSNETVVDILIRYGFDVNKRSSDECEMYLEAHSFVTRFRSCTPPIYVATVAGFVNIVALLTKYGANPNVSDSDGYTPMHNAAWHNHAHIISELVSNGAKVNTQDSQGSTPLRKAAYRGHTDTVQHLLCNGANPNVKNKRGKSALHCAALFGHSEVVGLLIQYGANINITDTENMTPMHAAAYNGKAAVVQTLIKANADLNIETNHGNTALHLACMEKRILVAGILVQAGADTTRLNRFGQTPKSLMQCIGGRAYDAVFRVDPPASSAELMNLDDEYREQLALKTHLEYNHVGGCAEKRSHEILG